MNTNFLTEAEREQLLNCLYIRFQIDTNNLARAASDGSLVASILKQLYPEIAVRWSYAKYGSITYKRKSWSRINQEYLQKIGLKISTTTIKALARGKRGVAQGLLYKILKQKNILTDAEESVVSDSAVHMNGESKREKQYAVKSVEKIKARREISAAQQKEMLSKIKELFVKESQDHAKKQSTTEKESTIFQKCACKSSRKLFLRLSETIADAFSAIDVDNEGDVINAEGFNSNLNSFSAGTVQNMGHDNNEGENIENDKCSSRSCGGCTGANMKEVYKNEKDLSTEEQSNHEASAEETTMPSVASPLATTSGKKAEKLKTSGAVLQENVDKYFEISTARNYLKLLMQMLPDSKQANNGNEQDVYKKEDIPNGNIKNLEFLLETMPTTDQARLSFLKKIYHPILLKSKYYQDVSEEFANPSTMEVVNKVEVVDASSMETKEQASKLIQEAEENKSAIATPEIHLKDRQNLHFRIKLPESEKKHKVKKLFVNNEGFVPLQDYERMKKKLEKLEKISRCSKKQ